MIFSTKDLKARELKYIYKGINFVRNQLFVVLLHYIQTNIDLIKINQKKIIIKIYNLTTKHKKLQK